ncbi:MAG: 6-phosphogluconolactonase [Actinomycetota bacterium]|nr:6-phosphogluconolactonase [Actinomycetota bacterium]
MSSAVPDPATIRVRIEVVEDAVAVARRGAVEIAAVARASVAARNECAIAVSGGRTPWAMFDALAGEDVPWQAVDIWQVDERVVPRGSEDRSITHLEVVLPAPGIATLHAMPVDGVDPLDENRLEAAADRYAATLPGSFDLIHLGLGEDGHTASLVPRDPVCAVRDRDVAVTGFFRGTRRMTLTYPVLDRAKRVLWIVDGATKADALAKLLSRDPTIPASRVASPDQLAIVDTAAVGR